MQVVLHDTEDLKRVLRAQPDDLSPGQIGELNYWLRHYLDASLNELLLEVAVEQGTNSKAVLVLATCALHNFEDLKLDPFTTLKRILAVVDRKGIGQESSFVEGFAEQVAVMLAEYAQHIERSGDGDGANGYLQAFLKLEEASCASYDQFWRHVMRNLPSTTFVPLARAVAGSDKVAEFGELYQEVLARVRSVGDGGPWMEKAAKEEKAIRSKAREVEQQMDQEQGQKMVEVQKAYDSLIEQRREEVKEENKDLRVKFIWSFAITVFSGILALWIIRLFIVSAGGKETTPDLWRVPFIVLSGVIFGLFGLLVAEELGCALGCLLLGLIAAPLVVVLSPIIFVIAVGFMLYYRFSYARKFQGAGLTPEEASARQLSLDRIEEYYREMRRMRMGEIVVSAILEA